MDTNLSTLTADADRVMWVTTTTPYVANFEMQASYEDDGDRKVFRYAAILHYKYVVGIESVVLLLRPEAEGPGFTGRLHYRAPGSEVVFTYRLVRVWQLPVERLLTGALATLPLAPIADANAAELPEVVTRMKARILAEAEPVDSVELWTTVALLMGLRYQPDSIRELLKGVSGLEESTIYQEILGKGQEIG